MKAVLVATDFSPSQTFAVLERVLKARGVTVISFLGMGKLKEVTPDEVCEALSGASVLLCGMSSSEVLAGPELCFAKAANSAGIRYGFYGDAHNCFARPWFADLAKGAAFYFGYLATDVSAATKEVFASAKGFHTGNMLRERSAFSSRTRADIRKQLGYNDSDFLIMAAGMKFSMGNAFLWSSIMQALASSRFKNTHLLLSPHPGDPALQNSSLYDELIAHAGDVSVRMIIKEEMPSDDAIVGVDVLIDPGTSIAFSAAYQRIPVLALGGHVVDQENIRIMGSSHPEAVLTGIAKRFTSPHSLRRELVRLKYDQAYRSGEVAVLEKRLPLPESTDPDAVPRKMADALLEI
tara:strand:- start:22136 stop:23185 length:1050 start_codon:yes stop_codon:yes gene_type:complete